MKIKKLMFNIAGIINSVIGGVTFLLMSLILMLKSVVETVFKSGTVCDEFVEQLVAGDSKYQYLEDCSQQEVFDFVWGFLVKMGIVVIIIALIVIVFAILNFVLAKKYENVLSNRKSLGTIFVVFTWVLMTLNIASVFTTLGVYLKDGKPKQKIKFTPPQDGRYSRF